MNRILRNQVRFCEIKLSAGTIIPGDHDCIRFIELLSELAQGCDAVIRSGGALQKLRAFLELESTICICDKSD